MGRDRCFRCFTEPERVYRADPYRREDGHQHGPVRYQAMLGSIYYLQVRYVHCAKWILDNGASVRGTFPGRHGQLSISFSANAKLIMPAFFIVCQQPSRPSHQRDDR
jgi:hypothetical protein